MKSVIIIPSYNSNQSLFKVLELVSRDNSCDVIIVDDGSDEIFTTHVDRVEVLRNSKNMGKGFSLKRAFLHAEERGFTHAVTLDADLQHNPEEIHKFISTDENADFVLGYRARDHSMPFHRKLSNLITTSLIKRLTKSNIHDSQCGFRRYNLILVNSFDYREYGFQFESEVLLRCINEDSIIKQINIETIYDENNKSYIKHVSDTLKFIRLIFRSLIGR